MLTFKLDVDGKTVQRGGKKYVGISAKDLDLQSPKLGRHTSAKGGICYGPNGEEFELGGKRRSGSFIEKIKGRISMTKRSLNVNLVGISNLFSKGAKTPLTEVSKD